MDARFGKPDTALTIWVFWTKATTVADWRGRTRGIYWRTMPRHRNGASFKYLSKNTSTVNQYQYKYSQPIDFKLVTIWESGIEGLIKKSITIEFQETYQIFWKILNLEILLAVLYNVNTVPETKRIVNCSNLSKALCTSKEWQSNCGHGVLPSSSSKCLHHLHSALVVKVPAPVSVL